MRVPLRSPLYPTAPKIHCLIYLPTPAFATDLHTLFAYQFHSPNLFIFVSLLSAGEAILLLIGMAATSAIPSPSTDIQRLAHFSEKLLDWLFRNPS